MDTVLATMREQAPDSSIAAEKRDLLARLLSRLAHEIRNPLSSLDIHVQLLAEDVAQLGAEARPKLTTRLDIIRGELTRLENMVKRFLRLASPSELELEPVQIRNTIRHVCNLLGPEAAARRIEIATEITPGLPALRADSGQLTQALLNLLINALQAVEEQGRIRVRARMIPAEARMAIDVHDSGPGVPPEKLASMFEPYFTTKEEGSGLGLWIAQQIAVAHGGALRVANAADGGAVFTLLLPVPEEPARG